MSTPTETAPATGNKHASASRSANLIPMSRVKTIMKSSPEITNINQDTLFSVCKATELFIQTVTREAYKKSSNNPTGQLSYEHLANLVSKDERFQFLSEIIPFKIKIKDAMKLIEADKRSQPK